MREIKVRGYATKEMVFSRWLYGIGVSKVRFSEDYAKQIGRPSNWHLMTERGWTRVHEESIGQYTGLKDKNGTEIYEGDILKGNYMAYTNFNVVVRFGEYKQDGSGAEYGPSVCVGFYAEAINKGQEDEFGHKVVDEYMLTSSLYDFKEIEVIGNKYENPELLEVD